MSVPTREALAWVADDFTQLIRDTRPTELDLPSSGTRWINRQLLFHMWFGQHIARVMVPVMGGFSRLPAPVSRGHARLLTAATGPYDWINYAGSVAGARAVSLERISRWMRHDTDWLLRWGAHATQEDLAQGMSVPPGWDPYFTAWMSRADLLDWAPKHYRHHRAQLTVQAAQ